MKIVLFNHSLISDWNHGNAHFLRGIVSELVRRRHRVTTFEAADAWSVTNLIEEHGADAIHDATRAYPLVDVTRYREETLDLDAAVGDADLVIVHEWNPPSLVRRIGLHRWRSGRYKLLFHDTHHRLVTAPKEMIAYDLSHYDGILAFGEILRELYLRRGWARRVWAFHEAADTHVFKPHPELPKQRDVVWIGNWGDGERSRELQEFLIDPVAALGLSAAVYGVRYPESAQSALRAAGVQYCGWLPNFRVPAAFAEARVTVHVPRGPYVTALPGIPTIRPFEALACGIPLVCSPWDDRERLFAPGRDYLVAHSGEEMSRHLRRLIEDPDFASELAARGLGSVRARHTCAHRVDQLMGICRALGINERLTQVSPHPAELREAP